MRWHRSYPAGSVCQCSFPVSAAVLTLNPGSCCVDLPSYPLAHSQDRWFNGIKYNNSAGGWQELKPLAWKNAAIVEKTVCVGLLGFSHRYNSFMISREEEAFFASLRVVGQRLQWGTLAVGRNLASCTKTPLQGGACLPTLSSNHMNHTIICLNANHTLTYPRSKIKSWGLWGSCKKKKKKDEIVMKTVGISSEFHSSFFFLHVKYVEHTIALCCHPHASWHLVISNSNDVFWLFPIIFISFPAPVFPLITIQGCLIALL